MLIGVLAIGPQELSLSGAKNRMFEGLFQPMHLIVILVIALLIFGPSKLASLGKGLGEGIRNFKSALREVSQPSESTDCEKK